MATLVLTRHGFSEWNAKNLFTGWVDVDLTERGIDEAIRAGKLIKDAGIEFDLAFTSVLSRAIKTCNIILEESKQLYIPQYRSWRLNERHYGALQGLNKAETAEKYGADQVKIWRRSYDILPPALARDSQYSAHNDRCYANLDPKNIPDHESLKVTLDRVLPYWDDAIAPALLDNKNVLVAAHGNSLRALIKYLEGISDDDILNLELATGEPIVYQLNPDLTIKSKTILK